jgi:hypothetical protein
MEHLNLGADSSYASPSAPVQTSASGGSIPRRGVYRALHQGQEQTAW